MPRTVGEKVQYNFTRGLITEQSPVSPIEGSAIDLENFEIEPAGGIRRRRAINMEHGGQSVDLGGVPSDAVFNKYIWRNAGGDPSRTVLVIQLGSSLWLWNESETPTLGGTPPFAQINLVDLALPGTDEEVVRTTPVSFADGRSHLFLTAKYMDPAYVTLSGNSPQAKPIGIRIRDFVGYDDGVPLQAQPTSLTQAHKYNLLNRGWTTTEYTEYFDDKGKYPSKAMISWLGYARQSDAGVQEGYGIKQWDSDKMEAEVFGDASSPQGRFYLNPFDTTVSYGNPDPSGSTEEAVFAITSWDLDTFAGSTHVVEVTTVSDHGLSTGDTVTISGNQFRYRYRIGAPFFFVTGSLDGAYDVTVTDTDTFTIVWEYTFTQGSLGAQWDDQYLAFGNVQTQGTIIEDELVTDTIGGYVTYERPRAVAYWAGRVWYAGTAYDRLADVVMFSQIAEGPAQYGRAHQLNYPTAETLNIVLPTDGGTLKVPGLHGVFRMEVLGGSLLLISTAGIWEITGGQGGFSATDYLVRKVSDVEAVSPRGVCRTDNAIIVATKRGLYGVVPDSNSGYLSAVNLTESRVNQYWLSLTSRYLPYIQVEYDDARRRVYVIHPRVNSHTEALSYVPAVNEYTEALVLDTRMPDGGAYYKITLPIQTTGVNAGYTAGIIGLNSADAACSAGRSSSFTGKPRWTGLRRCARTTNTALWTYLA